MERSFLLEAAKHQREARDRMRNAWLRAGGAAFWFGLWMSHILPAWLTFLLAVVTGVAAIMEFERALVERKMVGVSLRFAAGIYDED